MTDLIISADHRIDLALSGSLHQIIAVFFQSIIGGLRIITGHTLVSPHLGQCLQKTLSGNLALFHQCLDLAAWMLQYT